LDILCLDLEGVLVPEVWQAVAAETGIVELQKTTRDIPIYNDLMDYRLNVLAQHDVTLSLVNSEIAKLSPLPGAREFLDWARTEFQIAIVSDTFYEFAGPLMEMLGYPMLLCHKLTVENDRIVGYSIRQQDPKRKSVQAFKSLGYRVYAAGDSFNDLSMLDEADYGFFYCAPDNVVENYPQYPRTTSYQELKQQLMSSGAAPA